MNIYIKSADDKLSELLLQHRLAFPILLSDNEESCDIIIKDDVAEIFVNRAGQKVDSFSKPYRIMELFSVLSKINLDKSTQKIGACEFDYKHKNLLYRGVEIKLTDKEADIIRILNESHPEAISKKDLLSKVWGYKDLSETHTLETHIYRLRKKIDARDDFIVTDKDGYKINKTT